MDYQIRNLMKQIVAVEKHLARDGRGTPTYGTPLHLRAYVSGDTKMVRNMNGEEVASNFTLYFEQSETMQHLNHLDRLTLPDGTQPPIISVRPYYNEKGEVGIVEVYV